MDHPAEVQIEQSVDATDIAQTVISHSMIGAGLVLTPNDVDALRRLIGDPAQRFEVPERRVPVISPNPIQQCAIERAHEPHEWEGFIEEPHLDKPETLETRIYACPGIFEPETYLPAELYNDLQEHLLSQNLLVRGDARACLLLAARLTEATGASELRRRAAKR